MSAQPRQTTKPPAKPLARPPPAAAKSRGDNLPPPAELSGDFASDELEAILAREATEETPATPVVELSNESGGGGALVVAWPGNGEGGGGATAKAVTYDPVVEEQEYSRALMSPGDLSRLKADIDEHGFMTIEQVRELVKQHTVKETQEARGETYAIDPEMLMQIDTRTNFRVFISGDNIYTREELFGAFPFEAFHIAPEDVFVRQEVGVFSPKKWADLPQAAGEDVYEYVARDLGDGEEFIMIEDLVGRATRKNYRMKRPPLQIVKTKVFLGKDRWDDFQMMKRFVNAFSTFVTPLVIEGSDSSAKALAYIFGGQAHREGARALQGGLALERERAALEREQAALDALERERAALAREQAALDVLEAKAKALRADEEGLRRREEDLFRSLGLDPPDRPARAFFIMAEASTGGAPECAEAPDNTVAP